MSHPIRVARLALLMGCFSAPLGLVSGCEKPGTQGATLPARAADATYTTRARVESLPDPSRIGSEFMVMHEPVDTFFDPRMEKTVGMSSMSMPFSNLAPGVTLQGLAVGDAIEMTFGVWYKPDPVDAARKVIDTFAVQKLSKLPSGTELKFGRASPPLGTP